MTEFIENIGAIADRFDAVIIDLWGVLHDGTHPYEGAQECLRELKTAGKEIILLSNAPRRAVQAEERLTELGFRRGFYDHIITSGELTYKHFEKSVFMSKTAQKFYYIGPAKDRGILDGSGCELVANAADADFALATGFDEFGDDFATKEPFVREALAAGLTLYCANPDLVVVRQTGETMLCAGLLAAWYQKNGGEVVWFGKPHGQTYQACFDLFAVKDMARIAAIGDSFHTDIAGANAAGITSILCAAGIHKNDFGIEAGALPSAAQLQQVSDEYGKVVPDVVVPWFVF